MRLQLLASALSLSVLAASGLLAQQTPPAAAPAKGRGPGRNPANLVPPLEETGFKPIFDGKSLAGWDGDTSLWRVENGVIIGETSADKPIKVNTFLIWRGGKPGDFELKLDYRLTGGNTGVQYRSEEVPDLKWALKGYQADIDAQQVWTGQLYEERGRGFLALRGQASYVGEGKKAGVVASLGDGNELKALIKETDWNAIQIIARGNTLIHVVNGRVMSMVVDDDAANRKADGLLGFQLHVGPPMKLELRNLRLKTF